MRFLWLVGKWFGVVSAIALIPALALAEQTNEDRVTLELNSVVETDQSCTLTFVAQNGHSQDITRLVYETVLFDASGKVNRLTLFDFGQIPRGRTRVRQFAISDMPCGNLGKILFNGVHTCDALSAESTACAEPDLSTKTEIEVMG